VTYLQARVGRERQMLGVNGQCGCRDTPAGMGEAG